MSAAPNEPNPEPKAEYEGDEIPGRPVAVVGTVVVVVTIASIAISTFMLRTQDPLAWAVHAVAAPSGTVERTLVDAVDRGGDLKAHQRARLSTYGWADRDGGLARIPISRAIELAAGAKPPAAAGEPVEGARP